MITDVEMKKIAEVNGYNISLKQIRPILRDYFFESDNVYGVSGIKFKSMLGDVFANPTVVRLDYIPTEEQKKEALNYILNVIQYMRNMYDEIDIVDIKNEDMFYDILQTMYMLGAARRPIVISKVIEKCGIKTDKCNPQWINFYKILDILVDVLGCVERIDGGTDYIKDNLIKIKEFVYAVELK